MANEADKKEVKVAKPEKKAYEATYTIPELISASASEFGTTSIVVRAALKKAGKYTYTMKEAKEIVEKMKKKEVRA